MLALDVLTLYVVLGCTNGLAVAHPFRGLARNQTAGLGMLAIGQGILFTASLPVALAPLVGPELAIFGANLLFIGGSGLILAGVRNFTACRSSPIS